MPQYVTVMRCSPVKRPDELRRGTTDGPIRNRPTMPPDRNDLLREDGVGYDPDDGSYHLRHDESDPNSLCYTVFRAVGAITGKSPQALDPLTDTIDPDALEKLFDRSETRGGTVDACLTFEYNGCRVAIFSDGHLVVDPPPE